MTKMELSKESLFLLAKKISNKDFSYPLTSISNINNIKSNSLIINDDKKYNNKNQIKLKNKFLEKDNIKINEEKMLKLLIEKKKNKIRFKKEK